MRNHRLTGGWPNTINTVARTVTIFAVASAWFIPSAIHSWTACRSVLFNLKTVGVSGW